MGFRFVYSYWNNNFVCLLALWHMHFKKVILQAKNCNKKSTRRDSNPRPSPWQGDAPPLSHSCISYQPRNILASRVKSPAKAGCYHSQAGCNPPLKRVMGIEPTYPAWKAGVLPLNYTRVPRAGIEPATRGFSVLCSTN